MRAVLLDVHGITISVRCATQAQRELLLRDYGPFEVADLRGATARLEVVVAEHAQAPTDPDTITVDGLLGDRIHLTDDAIVVTGPQASTESAYFREIRSYLTATLISIVQRDLGGLDLHSSCVRPPGGGAVLFTGAKKAGKSSMALAMVDHGWTYLANEMTMLWRDGAEVVVATLPQAVAIAPGAQAWFANHGTRVRVEAPVSLPESADHTDIYAFEDGDKTRVERDEFDRADAERYRDRLAAIVFVEPAMELDEPRVRRVEPDDAAVRLMENVEYYLRWGRGPSLPAQHLLAQTAELVGLAAAGAPAFHLQWCPDHALNVAAVARAVGGSPS